MLKLILGMRILLRKDSYMKSRFNFLISALLFSALACQAVSSGSGNAGAEQPDGVLFQDDFSDPSSGWDRVNVEAGVTDYLDGAYRIFVNTSDSDVWANPGLKFDDVYIEVDATKIGGADDNDYGVICRYQDSDNFYFFVISSDGYYGLGKVSQGKQRLLGMDSMPPSEVIKKGNVTNHLRAGCVGNTLSLAINDELLIEEADPDFTSGDVGLIAGSFSEAGVDIHFDNFVVIKP
jgi:hypothetical protein